MSVLQCLAYHAVASNRPDALPALPAWQDVTLLLELRAAEQTVAAGLVQDYVMAQVRGRGGGG